MLHKLIFTFDTKILLFCKLSDNNVDFFHCSCFVLAFFKVLV